MICQLFSTKEGTICIEHDTLLIHTLAEIAGTLMPAVKATTLHYEIYENQQRINYVSWTTVPLFCSHRR